MPRKKIKVQRIPVNSEKRYLGQSPKALFDLVAKRVDLFGGTIRLLRLPSQPERILAMHIGPYGDQYLYELRKTRAGIKLIQTGEFTRRFHHRIIEDTTLRRKGIGSKALKTNKAFNRKQQPNFTLYSPHKTTTLFLLSKGYTISETENRYALYKLGLQDIPALMRFLKSKDTPENYQYNIVLNPPQKKSETKAQKGQK